MTKITTSAKKLHSEQREYMRNRHLEAQRDVAAKSNSGSGLVDERMLAESMRSVRYETEAHAASDLVDNSIEAGSNNVHLAYKTDGSTIVEIAIIDDGPGIVQEFLPHATKWGGSSNDGKRNLFGRFGFGLPSASVNRGRAFDVYSRTADAPDFKVVSIDLDNLIDSDTGTVPLPELRTASLPEWIVAYADKRDATTDDTVFPGGSDAIRTVVVWRNLDRLLWPRVQQSTAQMMEHFGITYAGWLDVVTLAVNGRTVEPVDVLFTTPGFRWYDIDGYPGAEAQSNIEFSVKDKNGQEHPVTVRLSYLSVDAHDAKVAPEGKGNHKKIRQSIRKDYNGIFVTRNGRFIELVKPGFINWNIYSRQVGIAIDFPPDLDEMFGVTPDKQSIFITQPLVDLLESHGVKRAFNSLAALVKEERARRKVERDAELDDSSGDVERPSESTISKLVETSTRGRHTVSEEAEKEASRNLQRRVKEIAAESGVDEKIIEEAQEKKHRARPYRVDFHRGHEDEPFYSPIMEGTQFVLQINTGHPWYQQLYSQLAPDQAELRSGLEVLLWILGLEEIDASGQRRAFYLGERRKWSEQLAGAFHIHQLVFNKAESSKELVDYLADEEILEDAD